MNEQTKNLLFFLFIFYILSSPSNIENQYPSSIDTNGILKTYQSNRHNNTQHLLSEYSDGYGNITGFHLSYKDALEKRNISNWPFHDTFEEREQFSILPNEISRRAALIWNTEEQNVALPTDRNEDSEFGKKINNGDFPINITSYLKGEFNKVQNWEFTKIPLDLPHYLKRMYDYKLSQRKDNLNDGDDSDDFFRGYIDDVQDRVGNVTDSTGKVHYSFFHEQDTHSDTSMAYLGIKINNENEDNEHQLNMEGVYHSNSGNFVAVTKSAKFFGPFGLPWLNLAPGNQFNQTKWSLFNKFNGSETAIKLSNIEAHLDAVEECEYVTYLHFESTNLTRNELNAINDEIQNPIGRPHSLVPDLRITSGIMYSPDCGILLELGQAQGPIAQSLTLSMKQLVIGAMILVFIQLALYLRQMARGNTPSNLARLSFWTVIIMNLADNAISVVALISSMIYTQLYVQFVALAFLTFTCSALYEMKYAIHIYCAQINERPINWRTMLQGTPIDERATEGNNNEITENVNNIPAIPTATLQGDEQTVGAELYSRNFFATLIFLFFILNATTWTRKARTIFEYVSFFVFNSFWIPQIVRNTLRGSRTSFTWEFIIGTSIIRLLPILYLELIKNPLDHHKDITISILLILWLTIQILILLAQELFGARFFLSDKYLPETYNYHPELTVFDLPKFHITESDLSNGDDDKKHWITDCAICMQKLDVPIYGETETGNSGDNESDPFVLSNTLENQNVGANKRLDIGGLVKRRKYMVTPCCHVFHTSCLEGWMVYKLQCPNCRSSLSPC